MTRNDTLVVTKKSDMPVGWSAIGVEPSTCSCALNMVTSDRVRGELGLDGGRQSWEGSGFSTRSNEILNMMRFKADELGIILKMNLINFKDESPQ